MLPRVVAACRTAGHAIQAVIAESLLIRRQGGAGGRVAAMITSAGRAAVARPHQPGEGVIAEGLVVGERATSNSGYGGRQLQDVAHVVVGARLAPDGVAAHGGAARLRALDAIIAKIQGEDGRRGTALGSGAAQSQAGELPVAVVGGLAHQEAHRVRRAGRAEVGFLEAPIHIVLRGHGLPIGIDQPGQFTPIVVAHVHHLRGGLSIGGDREHTHVLLPALVIAVTAPATVRSITEKFGGGTPHRVGGIRVWRSQTACWEGDAWITRVTVTIVEELGIGAVAAGIDRRLRCPSTQQAVEYVVAGIDRLVAWIDLAELVAVCVIAELPGDVTAAATAG